jgi:hypothetical protein
MRLYYRTFAAKEILHDGFRDTGKSYNLSDDATGVWVCDSPTAGRGDTLLTIEIPDDEIAKYEWIEKGKPYREFLVPAILLNRYGPPVLAIEEED